MDERIIWVNGCFDVLHRGHIELFKYAKSLGTKLYVGIDSDRKVKRDKGTSRPFNCLDDRIEFLKSIKFIDVVVTFDSTIELENTIKSISPDIMVVGSDWRGKPIVGEQYTKQLKFFERIPGYSTTDILERNKNYVS